jgi:sugar phosphate isomerase/epimerase
MDRIAIECLSVFGLPPVQLVELAADLGCPHVTINLGPVRCNPHGYPAWSLKADPALRRDMLAAMHHRGVSISLGEGFSARPNWDVRDHAADLDLMCELEVKRINAVSVERDLNRTIDQLGVLVDMADRLGIETVTEIGVGPLRDLPKAAAAISAVGRPCFRLLIDTMHFFRLGSTLAELATIDRDMIGYVQLCDAPLTPKFADYMEEALCERMVPGTGELPLTDLLAMLPRHLVIGIEVPMRSLAEAGIGPHERLSRCVDATRALLARAGW